MHSMPALSCSKRLGATSVAVRVTCLLTVLMLLSLHGRAQSSEKSDIEQKTSASRDEKTQVSAMLGNGRLSSSGSGQDMQWRSGELRFGREVDLSGLGLRLPSADSLRWDVLYLNEGQPENNHRDGFAVQAVYARQLSRGIVFEFGAGPYFSMNTTTVDGSEINRARTGALLSLALQVPLTANENGLFLRLGYNHVAMGRAPSSDRLMLGLGSRFGGDADAGGVAGSTDRSRPWWLEGGVGVASTTQAGREVSHAYAISARQSWGKWAGAVMALSEGDDGAGVDQRGLGLQGWRIEPLTGRWSIGAGFGPYLAWNRRDSDNPQLSGMYSLEVSRSLTPGTGLYLRFNRIQTFREKNDRDVFMIGFRQQFGT